MSDEENHVEPPNPPAEELADRLFMVSMVGILSFIAVVFIFIL
jgi:hypothetical protein